MVDFVLAVSYDGCNMIQEVRLRERVINLRFLMEFLLGNVSPEKSTVPFFLSPSPPPEWELCVEDEVAQCFS